MTHPLVSIIIPVFNNQARVGATIESALAQDWKPIEIIAVDDGSTDASVSRVREYESAGVITHCTGTNRGGSAARNTGFRASRGAYIQFLDHDDLLASDKISRQMSRALDHPGCVLAGRWTRFVGDVSGSYGGWCPPERFQCDTEPLAWLLESPMVPTCAWLTPRELIEAAGPWNEHLIGNPDDDGEFFMRMIAHSSRVIFCREARSYFRAESATSGGHNRSDDALRSIFEVCRIFEGLVLGISDVPAVKAACARRYLAFMHMAYPRLPGLIRQAEARVAALGLDPSQVPGTRPYERLSKLTGWRTAKRLQSLWHTVRETWAPPRSRY